MMYSSDAIAEGVRIVRGRSVHVGVRHLVTVHESISLQSLRSVVSASRDRRLVPQVQTQVSAELCQVHHTREISYSSLFIISTNCMKAWRLAANRLRTFILCNTIESGMSNVNYVAIVNRVVYILRFSLNWFF